MHIRHFTGRDRSGNNDQNAQRSPAKIQKGLQEEERSETDRANVHWYLKCCNPGCSRPHKLHQRSDNFKRDHPRCQGHQQPCDCPKCSGEELNLTVDDIEDIPMSKTKARV